MTRIVLREDVSRHCDRMNGSLRTMNCSSSVRNVETGFSLSRDHLTEGRPQHLWRRWTRNVECSMLNVECSALTFIQHSTLNIQHSSSPATTRANRARDAAVVPTLLLAILLLAACAQPRDQAARFRGADQSVNVLEISTGNERVVTSPYLIETPARELWMRQQVVLPDANSRTMCVYAAMLASFEVSWDGKLIGRSGVISNAGRAVAPGPMDNFFVIPASSANAGPHMLAFHVAFAQPKRNWFHGIVIGEYERMLRSRIVAQVVPLSGFAVFVVIGMYYLTLSFAMRRRGAAVTFALLCFASALLAVAETWRWTVGYTYDVQATRLAIISALTLCVSLLLPAFFILELNVPWGRRWIGACAAVLLAIVAIPEQPDDLCLRLFWASLLLSSFAIAGSVARERRRTIPGAVALSILIVAMVNGGFRFSDNTFFIAFCLMIVCLLVSMAIDLRRERRDHESAMLRAARLEIELLQKTIQPHFVMNTLTAVMEWLEEDPHAGVQFLEAFAEELRLFSTVSRSSSISLADEIALCRSHLVVMGCRKGKRFHLRADEVDPSSAIPPAIFHTLVENALTHNRYASNDVQFVLSEKRTNGRRRYVFDVPLSDGTSHNGDGTGLRYVKARLEETYPGAWIVESARLDESWRTTIEVPA